MAVAASSSRIPLDVPSLFPTVTVLVKVLTPPNLSMPPQLPVTPFQVPLPRKVIGPTEAVILAATLIVLLGITELVHVAPSITGALLLSTIFNG